MSRTYFEVNRIVDDENGEEVTRRLVLPTSNKLQVFMELEGMDSLDNVIVTEWKGHPLSDDSRMTRSLTARFWLKQGRELTTVYEDPLFERANQEGVSV